MLRKMLPVWLMFVLALVCVAQAVKPISKKGLVDALKIGGLTQPELVQLVKQRGVDFRPASADEAELRTAGASPDLLTAVKASYRAVAAPPPPASAPASSTAAAGAVKPLTKPEIVTLLQVGTPAERIMQLARERGIGFRVTPDVAAELQKAGAGQELLNGLNNVQPNHAPVAVPPKKPVMQRALVSEGAPPAQIPANAAPDAAPNPPVGPAAPAVSRVQTLKDVKTIFVDRMPLDLDQYVRVELSKQMSGRVSVVLSKEEADGILTGVAEAKSGTGSVVTGRYLGLHDNATAAVSLVDSSATKILWSQEAGDRSLVFGALKRGGQRKVAERIVSKLKKAME